MRTRVERYYIWLTQAWNGFSLAKMTLLLFLLFTAFAKIFGTLYFAGEIVMDGPSYLYFDFQSLNGFFGSIRTFPYPLLIRVFNNLIPLQILIPFLNLFFLAFSTAHLSKSFTLLRMNFASFIFIFLVLTSPILVWVPVMGTDLIGMSLWTLSFSLAARTCYLRLNNKFVMAQTAFCIFITYLLRPAYLAPAILLFLYVCFFLIKQNIYRGACYFLISFLIFNLLYFAPKYTVTHSPTVVDMTGGLLVGHMALLGDGQIKQESPQITTASKWVREAEDYLSIECKRKNIKALQESTEYNRYIETHNKCYSEVLIRIWTRAIFNTTGKLPLTPEYSMNSQMNAENYTWPVSSTMTLSAYHMSYSTKIDRILLAYDLQVLSHNKMRYLKLILLESFQVLKQTLQVQLKAPFLRLYLVFFLLGTILLQFITRKFLPLSSRFQSCGLINAQLFLFFPAVVLGTIITNVPHPRFIEVWIPILITSLLVKTQILIKGSSELQKTD
jgi:hypothetical protein